MTYAPLLDVEAASSVNAPAAISDESGDVVVDESLVGNNPSLGTASERFWAKAMLASTHRSITTSPSSVTRRQSTHNGAWKPRQRPAEHPAAPVDFFLQRAKNSAG